MLQGRLEHTGRFRVQTECKATSALAQVEEFQPDLCIIDLKMPGMDGIELVREIHSKAHLKSLPIIILTGLLTNTDVDAVTKDHVLHLSKPVEMKKLVYCIEEHLRAADSGAFWDSPPIKY